MSGAARSILIRSAVVDEEMLAVSESVVSTSAITVLRAVRNMNWHRERIGNAGQPFPTLLDVSALLCSFPTWSANPSAVLSAKR